MLYAHRIKRNEMKKRGLQHGFKFYNILYKSIMNASTEELPILSFIRAVSVFYKPLSDENLKIETVLINPVEINYGENQPSKGQKY